MSAEYLAEYATRYALQHGGEWITNDVQFHLKSAWPTLDPYFQRNIICAIEVELALGRVERCAQWKSFVAEMRGSKTPFTVDYRCGKCRGAERKLWRGVHGCADENGHKLLCAKCLAPDVVVDENGRAVTGNNGPSDQIHSWLPAVPTDDTYWGYCSVPSQDVDWWKALPTYPRSEGT